MSKGGGSGGRGQRQKLPPGVPAGVPSGVVAGFAGAHPDPAVVGKLYARESATASSRVEHAYWYGGDGKEHYVRGGANHFTLRHAQKASVQNATLTHNHPNGSSFSMQDYLFAGWTATDHYTSPRGRISRVERIGPGIREMRAHGVSRIHANKRVFHRLRPGGAGWLDRTQLRAEVNREISRLGLHTTRRGLKQRMRVLSDYYGAAAVPGGNWIARQHHGNVGMAKLFGYKYSRHLAE